MMSKNTHDTSMKYLYHWHSTTDVPSRIVRCLRRCNIITIVFIFTSFIALLWLYKEIAILFCLHFIISFSMHSRMSLSWAVSFVIFALLNYVCGFDRIFSACLVVLLIFIRRFLITEPTINRKKSTDVQWASLIDTTVDAASCLPLLRVLLL